MKSFKFLLCGTALALSLCMTSFAAFTKVNEYKTDMFKDVKQDAWYASEIKGAYELGFMNGVGENLMNPTGNVTVAEAVTMAARVNAAYNDRTEALEKATAGEKWYSKYVDYAKENGFLPRNVDSYTRPARRYEVASMFKEALPEAWFDAKNKVTQIPDVTEGDSFYSDILALYNAGVVMGSDVYGTFYPNNNITRSETAAIVNRVALPESRLEKTLEVYPYDRMDQAVYLIDDSVMTHTTNNPDGTKTNELTHGWIVDNRGNDGLLLDGATTQNISDDKTDARSMISRYITPVTDQKMVLETSLSFIGGANGLDLFLSESNKPVINIVTKNGKYGLLGTQLVMSDITASVGTVQVKLDLDLAAKKADLYIGDTFACTATIKDFKQIDRIHVATTVEDVVSIGLASMRLYMNYTLNETFAFATPDKAPKGWTVTGDTAVKFSNTGDTDAYSVSISEGTALRSFEPLKGAFVAEVYVTQEQLAGSSYVALKSGDKTLYKLDMANGKFAGSGKTLREYHADVWACIRFVRNADGSGIVRINGKDVDTPELVGAVDGIEIGADGAKFWFDDVTVYNTYEFTDYVAKPAPAGKDDKYHVCMSVCSLWREGTHFGWDYVAPYDELIPKMGFYDEGLAETADWEIKFMVEHGVDSIQPCWYTSTKTDPMKKPRLNKFAIHDGYFNAKYRDMLQFCIMWENQSNSQKSDLEQFKRLLWNYWIDWYFTDDNYVCFDNKPLITIYSLNAFIDSYGQAGAKEIIDFMNEDIKNYGYDGIILLFNMYSAAEVNQLDAALKSIGADGFLPYHWGVNSYDPEHVKQQYNSGYKGNGDNVIVACASTGRNIIGWEQTRTPIATYEQHLELCSYLTNDLLKTYEKDFGADSWQSKLIFLGTWNEYAEGHWLAPTGINGNGPQYDYATAECIAFTGKAPYEYNIEPTASQKARIGYLYPARTSPIRAWLLEKTPEEAREEEAKITVVKEYDMTDSETLKLFTVDRMDSFSVVDGYTRAVCESEKCKGNPLFRTLDMKGVNTDEFDGAIARVRSNVAANARLYFSTEQDTVLGIPKSALTKIPKANEWVDLYFDLRSNSMWTGTVELIRFDMIDNFGTFEVESIKLVKKEVPKRNVFTVSVDGTALNISEQYIENTASELYVAALPVQGFYSAAKLVYEWYRFDGKLVLKAGNAAKETVFEFNVGSKEAYVNGVKKTLEREFALYDAVPVLPIKFICDNAGYKYETKDMGIEISVRGFNMSDVLDKRVDHEYQFEIAGDSQGWTADKSNATVLGGNLIMTAVEQSSGSKWDPMLNLKTITPALLPAHCDKIVVRMKYELLDKEDEYAKVYFSTIAENSLSEAKSVGIKLSQAKPDNDGYVLLEFDMASKESWKGTITQLRFDPANCGGTFYIDYIKCIKKYVSDQEQQAKADANDVAVMDFGFDNTDDFMGWSAQKSASTVANGILNVVATEHNSSYDPILYLDESKSSFPAANCDKLVVRMKYELVGKTDDIAQVFFATDEDNALSESKSVTVKLGNVKKDSEGYGIYEFNMNFNASWRGNITKLRFDPGNCEGTFDIDYIKLVKKGGSPITELTPPSVPALKTELVNVDAEDTANASAMYSIYGGANKISIVKDPTNESNNVWRTEPSAAGKIYVSLAQKYALENGKTYTIEYDVYIVGGYDGNNTDKVQLWGNLIYDDPENPEGNHTVSGGLVNMGEWQHIKVEKTAELPTNNRSKDAVMLFASPTDATGYIILVDNLKVTAN